MATISELVKYISIQNRMSGCPYLFRYENYLVLTYITKEMPLIQTSLLYYTLADTFNERRKILPVEFFGSSSKISITFGTLYLAICSAQYALNFLNSLRFIF